MPSVSSHILSLHFDKPGISRLLPRRGKTPASFWFALPSATAHCIAPLNLFAYGCQLWLSCHELTVSFPIYGCFGGHLWVYYHCFVLWTLLTSRYTQRFSQRSRTWRKRDITHAYGWRWENSKKVKLLVSNRRTAKILEHATCQRSVV